MKTLIAYCTDNIGQMREENADAEVERMNRQTKSNEWYKDFSDQMYCPDETDEDVFNPCERKEGYCFVTCSNTIENW